MSDMAEQYYLARVSAFDDTPRKLLCTWHVDRAWRGGGGGGGATAAGHGSGEASCCL